VQCDGIRRPQQVLEFHQLLPGLRGGGVWRKKRIVGERGNRTTNPPETDDAQCRSSEPPRRGYDRVVPAAVMHVFVILREPAPLRQQHRDGVLSNLVNTVFRVVGGENAVSVGSGDVNLVVANSVARDHPTVFHRDNEFSITGKVVGEYRVGTSRVFCDFEMTEFSSVNDRGVDLGQHFSLDVHTRAGRSCTDNDDRRSVCGARPGRLGHRPRWRVVTAVSERL